ncbi:hypothetical protein JCM8097_008617 [Rhodosporidiobolus ruineniae]
MARRKKQLLSDNDSSGESDHHLDHDDDHFDPDDPDQAAERELFRNPYGSRGKKRTREQAKEDATYGIWADEDHNQSRRGGGEVGSSRGQGQRGSKPDYLKGQAFVAAGSKPSSSLARKAEEPVDNLAPTLAIEAAAEDEEDVAMEMGSSDEDDSTGGGGGDESDGERMSDDEGADAVEDAADDDEEDLPPVPGLKARTPTPPPPPPPAPVEVSNPGASLAFAPRGLSAGRGRGRGGLGHGGGGAGLGAARGGIGAGGAKAGLGAAPMFASSGSTLSTVSSSTPSTTGPGAVPTFTPAFAPSSSSSSSLPSSAPPAAPASPMAGAATPHVGLGSSRPGIGSASAAVDAFPGGGGGAGLGARKGLSTVEALRAEVTGPGLAVPREGGGGESGPASAATSASSTPAPDAPKERRSFLPSGAKPSLLHGGGAAAPKAKLSASESKHFASLASSGSIGLKMLERMGWQAGTGLGKERQGIVTPVGEGQKLRRKNEGIRQGERSKGALEEEKRRRGGDPADLGDAATSSAAAASAAADKRAKHASAWQSAKPKKEKKAQVAYKTYEEIVAEQGEGEAQQELLVDLNGQALPSQSLSSLPTSLAGTSLDPLRLPELRHNLTLLTSTFSSTLRSLAREGAGVKQRREDLAKEEARVRKVVEEEERKVGRLKSVVEVVETVKETAREAEELLRVLESQGGADGVGPEDVLRKFEVPFERLLDEFAEEFVEMGLDEVVVAALTPILRRLWTSWDPLTSPTYLISSLKPLRKHFRIDAHLANPTDALLAPSADPYEEEERLAALRKRERERGMTPYEALMWGAWVPKIRSAINNSWQPTDPAPAVALYRVWLPLLPTFLQDNLLDQLILPKLLTAIADWSPSSFKRGHSPALHAIVFPWLEVAGSDRLEQVLDEARRKVRSWVKSGWKAREGVPAGLGAWQAAFPKPDWDSLLLRHVLPALGQLLRGSFVVNPRQQELEPLDKVLEWKGLLRGSMLSQVLEAEFFPKWGEALYTWLCAEPNLEQVAEWYSWWKSYFPEDVVALSGVQRGFRKGLDLMNQAMALGEDAKYRLKKPDFAPKHGPSSAAGTPSSTPRPSASSSSRRPAPAPAAPAPVDASNVTFRTVVEDVAASSNLVFLPTGKTTSKGQQLFRVSRGIEGRGGVTVYLEDDVVWLAVGAGGKEEFEPVGVEEMVRRALGGKS